MEQIQKKFLKIRSTESLNQKKEMNVLRKNYINNVRNMNKKLSVLIAKLYSLKFDFVKISASHNEEYSNDYLNNYLNEQSNDCPNDYLSDPSRKTLLDNKWNELQITLNEIKSYHNKFIKSEYYAVYRSEIRNSVSSTLVKVLGEFPSTCKISINNCKDVFLYNGKKIYSKLIDKNYILIVDLSTIIQIPTDLIQLVGDSITVEYTDIFTSRFNNTYCYKGIDLSIINQIMNIFSKNISDNNIEESIGLIKSLL